MLIRETVLVSTPVNNTAKFNRNKMIVSSEKRLLELKIDYEVSQLIKQM